MRRASLDRHRQGGATLLELMIAMAIGAVVVAGMVMLYMQTSRAFVQQQAMADLQARGRLATQLIAGDLRQSGFWGEVIAPEVPDDIANDDFPANAGFDLFAIENALPVWGGNAEEAGRIGLPMADSMIPGSQAVGVRYANESRGPCLDVDDNRRLTVSTGSCTHWRLAQALYHLRRVDGGAPALYVTRRGSGNASETSEVVRYVERLEVEWGIDSNRDGSADHFFSGNGVEARSWSINAWRQVVAARLYVLVRSERPVLNAPARDFMIGGQSVTRDDGYLRRLFTTTVTIRNNRLRQQGNGY
ncbi:PilW family protein [Kushneria aurantia]|uniref:PilW family protein n=1 Tax=Kushneria aurantia TaxID=504092 RepID=A0ABV6FYQ2_9GAMM|nr:PilW family protein [Kushneria aurantia]